MWLDLEQTTAFDRPRKAEPLPHGSLPTHPSLIRSLLRQLCPARPVALRASGRRLILANLESKVHHSPPASELISFRKSSRTATSRNTTQCVPTPLRIFTSCTTPRSSSSLNFAMAQSPRPSCSATRRPRPGAILPRSLPSPFSLHCKPIRGGRRSKTSCHPFR